MKLRKWMAGMLAVCMMASAATTTALAAGEETTTDPQVTLVRTITTDTTLELGLDVKATDLKFVGTVIQYDKSLLQPASWNEGEEIIVKTVDMSSAAAWSNYGPVPSKGSDSAAAKPAMAFVDSSTNGKGYIYIGADSFGNANVDGRMVTIRFKLVDNHATVTKLTADNVKSAIGFSDNDAVTTGMIDDNIVLKTATALYSNKKLTLNNSAYTKLASGSAAGGGGTGEGGENGEWPTPEAGGGVATGGGGGLAVTFLDWDGSLLDTAALPEEAGAAKTALDKLTEEGGSLYSALTGKTGYAFDCWLNYTTLTKAAALGTDVPFTSNENSIKETATDYVVPETDLPSKADKTSKGLVLQAAYKENGVSTDGIYTFNKTIENANAIYCTRFGGASENVGKYSITLKMVRGNQRRTISPGLRIAMNPKQGQAIFSFQSAPSSDIMTFNVVPTKDMKDLTVELVEMNGASTWINARSVSGTVELGKISMTDVIKYGTANYIMEQAIQYHKNERFEWNENVGLEEFTEAGFTNINAGNWAAAKTLVLGKYTAASTGVHTYAEFAQWMGTIS